MTRQVDMKALISHIVKGDGADKCRICMGDTTEGQVYLGDTVMMDGERPVSLSDLLETITGVQVPVDDVLPSGLCLPCFVAAEASMTFRTSCLQTNQQWLETVTLLESLPDQAFGPDQKSICAFIEKNQVTIIDFVKEKVKKEIQVKEDKVKIENDVAPLGERYQCRECNKKFRYPSSLHTHLLEFDDQACFKCGKIMPRSDLPRHLEIEHRRKYYPCTKCPALLASERQIIRHNLNKHGPGTYSCPCCGRGFKTLMGCHVHVAVHEAKNCPNCGKLFRNLKCYVYHATKCCGLDKDKPSILLKSKLDVDKNSVPIKKKRIVNIKREEDKFRVGARGGVNKICICDYCGKKFSEKKYVCAHITIVHTKITHTPCPYCGKSYAAAHMTEHIKKHERIAPTFTCQHCGVVLKSRLGYEQHLRLHTGEKPYPCNYCSQTFSASSRRSAHVLRKHKNPELSLKHNCEMCRAKFRLPYLLKKHVETVHNSQAIFKCPECQVVFGSCRGLMHHRRKHQDVKLKTETALEIEIEEVEECNLISCGSTA